PFRHADHIDEEQRRQHPPRHALARIQRLEGREVDREGRDYELKDTFGTREVLEAIGAEVPQAQAVEESILAQSGGRRVQERLPAMASSPDARTADAVQPRAPRRRPDWSPCVQADAHPHGPALWPGSGR